MEEQGGASTVRVTIEAYNHGLPLSYLSKFDQARLTKGMENLHVLQHMLQVTSHYAIDARFGLAQNGVLVYSKSATGTHHTGQKIFKLSNGQMEQATLMHITYRYSRRRKNPGG